MMHSFLKKFVNKVKNVKKNVIYQKYCVKHCYTFNKPVKILYVVRLFYGYSLWNESHLTLHNK